MFAMFKQFFSMLSMWFTAMENLASAGNNLATWSNIKTEGFLDEARIERHHQRKQLENTTNVLLNADGTTVDKPQ